MDDYKWMGKMNRWAVRWWCGGIDTSLKGGWVEGLIYVWINGRVDGWVGGKRQRSQPKI